MIDWSTAPEWAIGAAMDEDGGWYWYEQEPTTADITWDGEGKCLFFQSNSEPIDDWEESWITKPILLPNNNMFTETKTTTTEKKSPFVFEEGGPVHPCTYGNIHDGISLRDYFAAKAMQSMIYEESYSTFAAKAYELADAMLEARTLKHDATN